MDMLGSKPIGTSILGQASMLELVVIGKLSARFDVVRCKDPDADLARRCVVPLLRLAVGRAGGINEARHVAPAASSTGHACAFRLMKC